VLHVIAISRGYPLGATVSRRIEKRGHRPDVASPITLTASSPAERPVEISRTPRSRDKGLHSRVNGHGRTMQQEHRPIAGVDTVPVQLIALRWSMLGVSFDGDPSPTGGARWA
jgi:hypothetical protein